MIGSDIILILIFEYSPSASVTSFVGLGSIILGFSGTTILLLTTFFECQSKRHTSPPISTGAESREQ